MTVALGGVVACGDSFGSDGGCKVKRTCEPVATAGSGAVGGAHDGAESGGQPSAAGDVSGGMAGAGDAGAGDADAGADGGADADAECASPADCDNGDASDGIEECFNGRCLPSNLPPTIIAVTPEDAALAVEPDSTIVIEVSEALSESTLTTSSVELLDGDRVVPSKVTYADNEITITPDQPLALLVPYEVRVTTAVADVDGAHLAEEFRSTFQVRDGAWTVAIVDESGTQSSSQTLQLNDRGEALLAWAGPQDASCPIKARWYQGGEPITEIKTLTYAYDNYCNAVKSAVSPGGLAIVSWFEESTSAHTVASAEFRGGKWGAPSARSTRYDYGGAVAATDDGVMHHFATSYDVSVISTSPAGVWAAQRQTLTPERASPDPRIAAMGNGKAVAVWKAWYGSGETRLLASSFDPESGTWGAAKTLPGSDAAEREQRGVPQVAFDSAGVPMVLWRRGATLVSSSGNASQDSWSGWTVASGTHSIPMYPDGPEDAPGFGFDGQTFVAAFTAVLQKYLAVYVARYDREQAAWGEPELVSAGSAVISRMPQLSADAHGNLLVTWLSSSATAPGVYDLVFQRFNAVTQEWSGPQSIPDAQIEFDGVDAGSGYFALGGNSTGRAALAFANPLPAPQLRLASFH